MLRTGLAAILLVVLLPVLVVANASTWALRAVLDDVAFTTTVTRVLDTPALERVVAVAIADEMVDRAAATAPVLVEQLGTQVLGIQGPVDATTVRAALAARVHTALDDPLVEAARDDLIRAVHRAVLKTAEGETGVVTVRGSDVILDPTVVVTRISTAIDPRISAVVALAGGRLSEPVVIAQVTVLEPVQAALDRLEALQLVFPLLVVAVILLILLLAHRRLRALRIVGMAIAVAGLATILVAWLAGRYVATIPDAEVGRDVAGEVYAAFLSTLVVQSLVLAAAGLLIALVAWVLGRTRSGRARSAPAW